MSWPWTRPLFSYPLYSQLIELPLYTRPSARCVEQINAGGNLGLRLSTLEGAWGTQQEEGAHCHEQHKNAPRYYGNNLQNTVTI